MASHMACAGKPPDGQNSDVSVRVPFNTSHGVQHTLVAFTDTSWLIRTLGENGPEPTIKSGHRQNWPFSWEGRGSEVPSPPPRCEHGTGRGHPQRQCSTSLPIQSPWKPLPGPLISCVKTTHEVTPAQSLIGSMGQQLFICTTAFHMTG